MKTKSLALSVISLLLAGALEAAEKKNKKAAKVEAKVETKAEAKPIQVAEEPRAAEPVASSYIIGGNLVQGYTFNPANPADGYNGTLTWTDRANEYQLNQAWMFFEIPTDTSKKDLDFGMRVDTMFGSSYRWATSAGFEDKLFKTNTGAANTGGATTSSQYGLAIPQAYVDAAYKSFKLRIGHIISPVGFFTIDTTQNIFMTLPYTYQYGEPFTHFGAWLYYTVNDKLNVMGGVTRGGDNFDGSGLGAKVPGFLGTLTYIFDDKSSLDWVVHISKEYNYKSSTNSTNPALAPVAGSYNDNSGLYSWRYFQTLVYKRSLTSKLQWVFQTDFGVQNVADVKASLDASNPQKDKDVNAMWFGANTYLIYQMLQTLQLAINFEWFRDNNGVRVGAVLPTMSSATSAVTGLNSVAAGSPALTRANYVGDFFQVTFGPKWQPQKNFFVRLNGRYDYFAGTALNASATNGATLPFKDGSSRDQFVIGLDAALLW